MVQNFSKAENSSDMNILTCLLHTLNKNLEHSRQSSASQAEQQHHIQNSNNFRRIKKKRVLPKKRRQSHKSTSKD